MMIRSGPISQSHTARLALVQQLSDRLQNLYLDQVIAIALYGSVARGQDGPYSDVELLCFVAEQELDQSFEWVYGAGKAEINVLGQNDARWEAKEVDIDWAVSKGAFLEAKVIFGDEAFVIALKESVLSVSDDEINSVIGQVLVDELYEWVGKVRNALHTNSFSAVPSIACKFAETIALLLGLAHRTCYTTGMTMLDESLLFDDLPIGYQDLCNLVREGSLNDAKETIMVLEAAWSGIVSWVMQRNAHLRIGAWPFSGKDPT